MLGHYRRKSASQEIITATDLLRNAKNLSLGRLLLLARTCFKYFQEPEVQANLGLQGIIRETVGQSIQEIHIKNLLSILNVDGPLSENLNEKLREDDQLKIDEKTWINLIYSSLRSFITKTDSLKPTTRLSTETSDGNNRNFFDYCDRLASSDNANDQVIAEIVYGLFYFAVSLLKAQKAAQQQAQMDHKPEGSSSNLFNHRLDSNGVGVVLAPIFGQLLFSAADSLTITTKVIAMISNAAKELLDSDSSLPAFEARYQNCYKHNSELIHSDGQEERTQLKDTFRNLFLKMAPDHAEMKKAAMTLDKQSELLDGTSMSEMEKKEILTAFIRHYNNVSHRFGNHLQQLKNIHQQLQRACDTVDLRSSDTRATHAIIDQFEKRPNANNQHPSFFPIGSDKARRASTFGTLRSRSEGAVAPLSSIQQPTALLDTVVQQLVAFEELQEFNTTQEATHFESDNNDDRDDRPYNTRP